MTIVFNLQGGGYKVLRPSGHLSLNIIQDLAHDFRATNWMIK